MRKAVLACCLAILGLTAWAAFPAWGTMVRLDAGNAAETTMRLEGGKRACVLFCGDHDPVQDLLIRVYDSKDRLVAEAGGTDEGDMLCAIWYPERTDDFRVRLINGPKTYNFCTIVVK